MFLRSLNVGNVPDEFPVLAGRGIEILSYVRHVIFLVDFRRVALQMFIETGQVKHPILTQAVFAMIAVCV